MKAIRGLGCVVRALMRITPRGMVAGGTKCNLLALGDLLDSGTQVEAIACVRCI